MRNKKEKTNYSADLDKNKNKKALGSNGKPSKPLVSKQRDKPSYGEMKSYVIKKRLGGGTYSDVYQGKSLIHNSYVALKRVKLENEEGAPNTALREISILRMTLHNNIIMLHDIIQEEKDLIIVFELAKIDLKQFLKSQKTISLNDTKILMFQLLRAVNYIHRNKIIHRDIKPQNILINERGELKLADFGLARANFLSESFSPMVVTLWYRAPDVILGSTNYSYSIDYWSVGCLMAEMVTRIAIFRGSDEESQLKKIMNTFGQMNITNFPKLDALLLESPYQSLIRSYSEFDVSPNLGVFENFDETYLSLILKHLQYDPEKRIPTNESMKHELFSSLGNDVQNLNDLDSIYECKLVKLDVPIKS